MTVLFLWIISEPYCFLSGAREFLRNTGEIGSGQMQMKAQPLIFSFIYPVVMHHRYSPTNSAVTSAPWAKNTRGSIHAKAITTRHGAIPLQMLSPGLKKFSFYVFSCRVSKSFPPEQFCSDVKNYLFPNILIAKTTR